MRGKVIHYYKYFSVAGITPAYAGKSVTVLSILRPTEDHPRLCGEKIVRQCFCGTDRGSPPPMRGKGFRVLIEGTKCGITPAYAGKSPCCRRSCPCTRDHPRLCGEKHSPNPHRPRERGSPPPMRGKVFRFGVEGTKCGITPAYAGKRIDRKYY